MDKTLYSALKEDQNQNNVTMINSALPTTREFLFGSFDENEITDRGRGQPFAADSGGSNRTVAVDGNGEEAEDADDDDEEDDEDGSPQPEEMCPLVRPSSRQHHQRHNHSHHHHQPELNSTQRNSTLRNHLSLPLMSANTSPVSVGNCFATKGENHVPPNETFNVKLPFQQKNFLRQTSVGVMPPRADSAGGADLVGANGTGSLISKPSSNGKNLNPMVMIGLNNDEDQYSSSSPFHSATEDFGMDNDNDRDPLIKPPAKTGGFHQLLSGKGKSKSSGDADSAARDKTANGTTTKRKCSVGIFLAAISCIFFATSALIVKISDLHPMELLGVRGLLQGIFVAPLVISTKNSFLGPKGSRSLLLSRAVLGAVALVMSFASIHLIPLADAATVIFTSPVFVSIFACLCLGEVCTWFDVAMIGLTLLGVLLVSKPSFGFISSGSWTSIVGTFCGLAAAMLTALAFIVLRQLKHVHYSVTVFWFSTVLASFGAVLTVALDGFSLPTRWTNIAECIGIGVCGFLGQILLTKALQMENAGPVAVARTMDIVLAFFYQITFLHDTPDWKSYLGSVLVVSCVLLTAFRRWYKDAKCSDKTAQSHPTNHRT